MNLKYFLAFLLFFIGSLTQARVEFELSEFKVSEFRDFDDLQKTCGQEGNALETTPFWCDHLEEELSLIQTKSTDYFFAETGELFALFTKQQKGQDYLNDNGYRFGLDSNQNLIPIDAGVPGGATLLNETYVKPKMLESRWEKVDDARYQGVFNYELEDVLIEKTLTVESAKSSITVNLKASRLPQDESDESDAPDLEEATVYFAVPGIARTSPATVKIGQGTTFALNPLSQPASNPTYASIQNNNRNTANALILRPAGELDGLSAQFLQPNIITLQKTLKVDPNAEETLAFQLYGGLNELVRYHQEGYLDLEGLFRPNILGQLSFGILWLLEQIHSRVGGWGLTIILLTLLFRVLIWPLITTQTKSMYAMQQLQPKIQALQKKYKEDREKLTQETMKLYKTEGVNPAGGCLPILLQMPLFIILWRVFANFEFNEGFLWIPDLGQADPFYILPILYVAIIFGQSYFMAQGNPQSLRQQLLMNAIFVFFIISFPAGVSLYLIVSMFVQVVQYWLIKRQSPVPAKST